MTISIELVKELRLKTSAGMMDCKKALTECSGDINSAIDWLRKKGLASASKKSGRISAEGLIGVFTDENKGAIIEVNSETDFVARNPEFQEFVYNLSKVSISLNGDVKLLEKNLYPNSDKNIDEVLKEKIAKIGENLIIRRSNYLEVNKGIIASYIHNPQTKDLGKIGVLIAIESSASSDKLLNFGKKIAMHVAAASPASVNIDDLSKDLVDRERKVLVDQAIASGKPEEIAKKMVEGRLRKFYSEVVLMEQIFVVDGETKVSDIISKYSKELNEEIKIKSFIRYNIGEGIDKENKNFADEVAEQLKS